MANKSGGTFRLGNQYIHACGKSLLSEEGIGKGREHYEGDCWHESFERTSRFNSIHYRHDEVDHNQIRAQLEGFVDSVASVSSLATDGPLRLTFK